MEGEAHVLRDAGGTLTVTSFSYDIICNVFCGSLLQEAKAKARKAFGGLFNRKPGLLSDDTEEIVAEEKHGVEEEEDSPQDDGAPLQVEEASYKSSFIMKFGPTILLIFLSLAFLLLALDFVNSRKTELQ